MLSHAQEVFRKGDHVLAAVISLAVFEKVTLFKKVFYSSPHAESAAYVKEAYTLLQTIASMNLHREIRFEIFEEIMASYSETYPRCELQKKYEKLLTMLANEPVMLEAIDMLRVEMIWSTRYENIPTNWHRYFSDD